jgi:uncharacterized membrane protein
MRKTADRIRHAISFEVIAVLILSPLAAIFFHQPLTEVGVVTIVSGLIATGWNYVYNLGFDHAMLRLRGSTAKTVAIRIGHAVLFELGLFLVLVPFIAWYLDMTLAAALVMDLSFSLFYLVYAFVFNWAYDVIFPVPSQPAPAE